MSAVEISNVRKSFGAIEVLKGVSLAVEEGEVLALLGASGSGKTTLLRCINGLEKISAGEIKVYDNPVGHDLKDLQKLRLRVGMIFQQFNLFPHLSAGRNIMLAQMVVKKTSVEEAREIAKQVLEKVGLEDKFDRYPDELSGGQQQRVAIARALAMRPSILLCDEITSALDPELVGEVLTVVRQLAAEGMTLIMVTHEMGFAREVCDKVVFMHQGMIRETGAPSEFFARPQTTELRQFLGQLVN